MKTRFAVLFVCAAGIGTASCAGAGQVVDQWAQDAKNVTKQIAKTGPDGLHQVSGIGKAVTVLLDDMANLLSLPLNL